MPKQRIHISDFRSQVRPGADPGDLSPESAEYAEDVDIISMPGAIQGRRGDDQYTGLLNVSNLAFASAPGLLFINNEGEYIVRDLDASSNTTMGTGPTPNDPNTVHPRRASCRFGGRDQQTKWAGTINHGQFGGSPPSGTWHVREARLVTPEDAIDSVVSSESEPKNSVPENNDDAAIEAPFRYFYGVSFVYDGFQEGPFLYYSYVTAPTDGGNHWWKRIDYTLKFDASKIPDRVTHIVYYVLRLPINNNVETIDDVYGAGSFAKVRQVPITTADYDSSKWTNTSGSLWKYTIEDRGTRGAFYNDRTGVTQALDHMNVRYGLSESIGGFSFYSGATIDGTKGPRTLVVRSKAKRPDVIDWSLDSATFEFEVVAMKAVGGLLAVFGRDRGALLNPKTLAVEDWFDSGCVGPECVAVGNDVLFWASAEQLHLFDGQSSVIVGQDILSTNVSSTVRGWNDLSLDEKEESVCAWMPTVQSFVMMMPGASDGLISTEGWALYLPRTYWEEQRPVEHWRAITGPSIGYPRGSAMGNGLALLAVGGNLYDMFASSSRKSWRWVSKEFGGGQPGPDRVFYHLELVPDRGIKEVRFREDRGSWSTPPSPTSNDGRRRYVVNSDAYPPWKGVTRFQFEMKGDGDVVRAASLVFRPRTQSS